MSDYTFALFLGFSGIWILLGIGAIYWIMKMENKTFSVSKEMILVSLSIVLPFAIALWIGQVK